MLLFERSDNLIYCIKCKKKLENKQFYRCQNKNAKNICKQCLLLLNINPYNIDTFSWVLKLIDVPYVKSQWNLLLKRWNGIEGTYILRKYLAIMDLYDWKECHWEDTKKLNKMEEEHAIL